ncbi:hypothetical protein Dimus_000703 [Dionaea muscipula]
MARMHLTSSIDAPPPPPCRFMVLSSRCTLLGGASFLDRETEPSLPNVAFLTWMNLSFHFKPFAFRIANPAASSLTNLTKPKRDPDRLLISGMKASVTPLKV